MVRVDYDDNSKIICSFFIWTLNPIALSKVKIAYNFGLSECNRVKVNGNTFRGRNSAMLSFSTPLNVG